MTKRMMTGESARENRFVKRNQKKFLAIVRVESFEGRNLIGKSDMGNSVAYGHHSVAKIHPRDFSVL